VFRDKICHAFVVNAFAKLYFIHGGPFLLPLHEGVISLPFLKAGGSQMKFSWNCHSCDAGNNSQQTQIFTEIIPIFAVQANIGKLLDTKVLRLASE
jgi:hypothetical protein